MEFVAILNVQDNPDLVRDTLESIEHNLTSNIV